MKVDALTQKINQLTEKKEFALALLLVNQHRHYHVNYMFNDAYATLLYCTNRFAEAKKIICFNIKLIKKQAVDTPALLSNYFLKALCYLAENNIEKTQVYIQKCLRLSADNPKLQQEFKQFLQLDSLFTQKTRQFTQ